AEEAHRNGPDPSSMQVLIKGHPKVVGGELAYGLARLKQDVDHADCGGQRAVVRVGQRRRKTAWRCVPARPHAEANLGVADQTTLKSADLVHRLRRERLVELENLARLGAKRGSVAARVRLAEVRQSEDREAKLVVLVCEE